ncbi:hypothetical protein [Candidatus Leptofilum sp.]|uniref:hypothetical protein n=1 Tax=Candidatus Leptofilum sp. TaxID=3241576 RepID=UPI003B5A2F79
MPANDIPQAENSIIKKNIWENSVCHWPTSFEDESIIQKHVNRANFIRAFARFVVDFRPVGASPAIYQQDVLEIPGGGPTHVVGFFFATDTL